MAIGTRIVMIILPFILCFMQLSQSQSMESKKCNRVKQGTVADLLSLTKRLFDRSTNLNETILPANLTKRRGDVKSMKYKKRLAVVSSLLSIVSQKERYNMADGDSEEVNTLNGNFKRLINVICKYLMSIGIDCSNANATEHVLQLLKLREQVIKSHKLLNDLTLEGNYNEEYVTWRSKVEPNFKENETRGFFGSFPSYNATCTYCSFNADQCPNPH